MQQLLGKTAVITGGTRGIGLAIAQAFAAEGAKVVVASRSQLSVEQAINQILSTGGQATGSALDVANLDQVKALSELAIQKFGRMDIWVNNAGISGPYGPTAEIEVIEFYKVIQTNIIGTYNGSRTAIRHFLEQGSGKLINLVGAGVRSPQPRQNAYGSSKAWVRMFTKALAEETRGRGVGVFTFQPGLVYTELLSEVEAIDGSQARLDRFPSVIRILSKPADAVASKVVWLASAATDGKTGLEVSASSRFGMLGRALVGLFRKPVQPIRLNIKVIPPAAD